MNFVNITGKKETKGFTGEIVQTTCTNGDFKISPAAGAKLGLKDGENLVFQQDADTKIIYVGKGIKSDSVVDAEGNLVLDEKGREQFVDGTGFGCIIRPSANGGINFKATAAFAWSQLGGNSKMLRNHKLGEGVEVSLPTGKEVEILETTLYPLEFVEEVAKMERKSTKPAVDVAGAEAVVAGTNSVETEEEEEEENDGFTSEEV